MSKPATTRRLDSWKEIAEYLGRDLRTVMRWEQERGLPVRRVPGGKRSAVFAYAHEVDDWMGQGEGQTEVTSNGAADARGSANRAAPAALADGKRSRRRVLRIAVAAAVLLTAFFAALRFLPSQPQWPSTPARREVSFEGGASPLRFLRTDLDLGIRTYRIRAGDFNEDGRTDLVFTSAPNDQLGILFGKGGAVFTPPRLYEGCAASDDVVVTDFNHDGHADLAVSCVAGNKVILFWGKGDGNFSGRSEIEVPGGPRTMAAADLTGDGWPDLAVATNQGAFYLLKNSRGQLTPSVLGHFDIVAFPVFADWDGDGTPDLLAGLTIHGKPGIGLFPGRKDGTLGPLQVLAELPAVPYGLVVGDFGGDGQKGLAVASWDSVYVFLRQPRTQTAVLSQQFLERTKSWFLLAADLDSDGKLDLLGSNTAQGTLIFFRGLGNGRFADPATMTLESYSQPALVSDLDGDRKPEILVPAYTRNSVILLKAR